MKVAIVTGASKGIDVLLLKNLATLLHQTFGEGKKLFTNPVLEAIGKKYKKSTAQVMLRRLIERRNKQ